MENCIFYCKAKDGDWYMCTDCGYKERFRFLVCPVCENRGNNTELQKDVRNAAMMLIESRTKQ